MTEVTINNPMCVVTYYFNSSKEEFMSMWNNHITGVGFFTGEVSLYKDFREVETLIISPAHCSFIQIKEVES